MPILLDLLDFKMWLRVITGQRIIWVFQGKSIWFTETKSFQFSFISSLSLLSSIYALMFHSIERYVVISNPLKYRTGSVDRDDSKIMIDWWQKWSNPSPTCEFSNPTDWKLLESVILVLKGWQNTCCVLLGSFPFYLHRSISLFHRHLIRKSYE